MDFNIRNAVMNNLNSASYDDIYATIKDAVSINEEKVLPGLGVMFEVLWKKCDDGQKSWIVSSITQSLS